MLKRINAFFDKMLRYGIQEQRDEHGDEATDDPRVLEPRLDVLTGKSDENTDDGVGEGVLAVGIRMRHVAEGAGQVVGQGHHPRPRGRDDLVEQGGAVAVALRAAPDIRDRSQ